MALLRNLRAKEALECWDKIDDPEYKAEITTPIARAYLEVGRQDKALELVLPLWKPQTDDREQLHIADMLLRIYGASHDDEAVGKIIETIERIWPNESFAYTILSHERHRSGHGGDAIRLLLKAQAAAREHEKASVTLELAWAYFSEKQWKESAEAYRAVVDASTDNYTRGKYLTALYNSGAFRDAYVISKELRGTGDVLPVITEIESLVLEQIGDFEQAKDLRVRLSKVEPRNAGHKVRVAMLELRCGTKASAAEALKQITFDDIKDNAFWLLQVAQARLKLGLPDYLPLAYRARRIDYGNPQTHLAYFGLMVGREKHDEAPLDVEQVQVDCTVCLRRGDEKKVFTILDEKDVDPSRGELHRNDQLAQKLLGKRKGEQVVLRQSPLEELSYDIVNIQSKYVHAFQESISNFTTLFPEHYGFWQIQVKEHDVTKVLRVVDERAEEVRRAMDLYSQAPATLGCIGQLLGGGSVEMWYSLIGWPTARVRQSPARRPRLHAEGNSQPSDALQSHPIQACGFSSMHARQTQPSVGHRTRRCVPRRRIPA
jgi:transcription elongation GreA/GreB family factor/RNA binding exosome subunit